MFLEVDGLLAPAEISRLLAIGTELRFVEGRLSNPANATKVNLQADLADPRYAESSKIVADAFQRCEQFLNFAFPKCIAPPLMSRYETGMKYGAHADTALMHVEGRPMRSDLSATVWIGEPESYVGGELVVHLGTRPIAFKGKAGSAIIYPSTTLHEVRPVRSGRRLVSITFIESHIADEFLRTQLYELDEVAALEGNKMSWEGRVRLEAVRQNLRRLWTKP